MHSTGSLKFLRSEDDEHQFPAQRPEKALTRELKITARLGLPLALGELGWMSTYIVDAIMIGRLPHSALAISASSLGNTIYYAIVFCAIGMLTGVETLVAQSFGRGDAKDCTRTLAQSLWFVAIGTPLVMGATLLCLPLLSLVGTSAEIVAETGRYLHPLIWSTAPLLLYMALRRYLQSMNRVVLVSISLITSSLVNFVGDWAFLYGHLGLRPMGIAGSAWATVVVRLYMFGLVLAGVGVGMRKSGYRFSAQDFRPDFAHLSRLAHIGWPAGVQSLTDLGFSTYMSVICARLGTTMLAAHQVVLDLDACVYMIPLGLSYATVARVGQNAGLSSIAGVRRSAKASLLLGMGYIVIASALFAGLPRLWAGIYTNDPAVIAAAVPIFIICGVLQLGDAANVLCSSALTGLGDTRTPLLANTLVFWTIGMPLSYWLAFHTDLSLRGLWIGRGVAAVVTGAVMATAWYRRIQDPERGHRGQPLRTLQPLQFR